MAEIEKLDFKSMNIAEDKLQKIKELFPEIFTEGGKIDFEKLRLTLGETVDTEDERFGLHWAGKKQCFKIIQQPSIGTLKPAKEESVNWDTTENLFIEGDNLEVLKQLQKSYYGKVKMIYIDPPYNTGKEFIYPDNYKENIDTYLAYSGQTDDDGYKFSTNTETEGRFHSKWLNMMYPRLFLARNLLKEDGLIFLSIDDNELTNLKPSLNEIFGEENYLGILVIDKNRKNDARFFSIGHDYMLVYAKNKHQFIEKDIWFREIKEGVVEMRTLFNSLKIEHGNDVARIQKEWRNYFKTIDKDLPLKKLGRYSKIDINRGPYRDDGNISWPGGSGPKYEVLHPITKKPCKVPDGGWRYSKPERFWEEVNNGRVGFGDDETTLPRQVRYLFESDGQVMQSVTYSYAQTATLDFNELMGAGIFENPKYWKDISRIINYSKTEGEIILDFFGGSATTAHAVLNLNSKNAIARKFILVQLPEPTSEKSVAFKTGYKNIAEIGKERVRRVADNLIKDKNQLQSVLELKTSELENLKSKKETSPKLFDNESNKEVEKLENYLEELRTKILTIENADLGFKVFKLEKSNFKIWDGSTDNDVAKQIELAIDHINPDSSEEDILYEILLKSGFELTVPINELELESKKVFSIAGDALLICLEKELSEGLIRAIAEKQPARVVCLDAGFKNNDQLKTNAVQIMKSHEVHDFRTV